MSLGSVTGNVGDAAAQCHPAEGQAQKTWGCVLSHLIHRIWHPVISGFFPESKWPWNGFRTSAQPQQGGWDRKEGSSTTSESGEWGVLRRVNGSVSYCTNLKLNIHPMFWPYLIARETIRDMRIWIDVILVSRERTEIGNDVSGTKVEYMTWVAINFNGFKKKKT